INDTAGHQAGDQYLRDACRIICDTFSHSPVFRIGGDEFVVISQGRDYTCIDKLMDRIHDHNTEAFRTGGVMIAGGIARFGDDACVASVFDRADQSMYENKKALKDVGNML
ncbi:MAG: GGDEF domain-containing protein, partial [Clostridia bacterium]